MRQCMYPLECHQYIGQRLHSLCIRPPCQRGSEPRDNVMKLALAEYGSNLGDTHPTERKTSCRDHVLGDHEGNTWNWVYRNDNGFDKSLPTVMNRFPNLEAREEREHMNGTQGRIYMGIQSHPKIADHSEKAPDDALEEFLNSTELFQLEAAISFRFSKWKMDSAHRHGYTLRNRGYQDKETLKATGVVLKAKIMLRNTNDLVMWSS